MMYSSAAFQRSRHPSTRPYINTWRVLSWLRTILGNRRSDRQLPVHRLTANDGKFPVRRHHPSLAVTDLGFWRRQAPACRDAAPWLANVTPFTIEEPHNSALRTPA